MENNIVQSNNVFSFNNFIKFFTTFSLLFVGFLFTTHSSGGFGVDVPFHFTVNESLKVILIILAFFPFFIELQKFSRRIAYTYVICSVALYCLSIIFDQGDQLFNSGNYEFAYLKELFLGWAMSAIIVGLLFFFLLSIRVSGFISNWNKYFFFFLISYFGAGFFFFLEASLKSLKWLFSFNYFGSLVLLLVFSFFMKKILRNNLSVSPITPVILPLSISIIVYVSSRSIDGDGGLFFDPYAVLVVPYVFFVVFYSCIAVSVSDERNSISAV